MEFVIITGLSGAGKSRAAEFLEDIGFYTVDNIPPELMPRLAELCAHSSDRYERVALVSDVRSADSFEPLLKALDTLSEMNFNYRLLFMEADLPTIIKRYNETRRAHPLAETAGSLAAAADRERELLRPVRDRATYVLDTTPFSSSYMLKAALQRIFCGDQPDSGLAISVMSFGYKYGVPLEADIILDVRFLPNPYYVQELKPLTGKDEAVRSFLFSNPVTGQFLDRMQELLELLLPNYEVQGKRTLTLAFGCTGGRHRSVAMASEVAAGLREHGCAVSEYHRDLTRN